MNLETLFAPRSVAVIGASDVSGKVGHALMKNILAGKGRKVFPVTLNKKKLFGKKAYASILDVPCTVDCAVIAVRADFVAGVVEDCAKKGVKSAVVISAGFKEIGDAGKEFEARVAQAAEEHRIPLLGPNCLGVMNAQADWNASFAVGKPLEGGISFISQSGAIGTALLDWANKERIGFAKFVSLGNEAVLTELELLEYIASDTSTKAVFMYLEKVTNGAQFLALAKQVAVKKPLVILRAGRSERGSAAVASHTGSLAPSDAVFDAALHQAGAIPVTSLRELFSLAKLFQTGITTPLHSLAIITNGGGPSVNAADLIGFSRSLSLVTFSDVTKKKLRSVLPPMAAVGNPIDVIGDAPSTRYVDTLAILTKLKDIEAILVLVTPQMMTNAADIAAALSEFRKKKPIVPVFMGGYSVEEGIRKLKEQGFVNFDMPSDAISALNLLGQTKHKIENSGKKTKTNTGTSIHLSMLHIDKMDAVLQEFGLHLEGQFVREGSELGGALQILGDGPYAIKAISQELVHKSDLKAVQLNLPDRAALERAWGEIYDYTQVHTPGATIDGMLVQKMVSGQQIIIGMKRDHTFGPVILFGLGGIFVEIMNDVAMRIAPVTKTEALAQIRQVKSFPLLSGTRGQEPADLDALADIIVRISKLSLAHPEIQEIDFNPVLATLEGAHIVDARVMV